MKIKKIFIVGVVLAFSFYAAAGTFTFTAAGGEKVSFSIPDELDSLVSDYQEQIQNAITENGVTQSQLNSAKSEIEGAVKKASENSGFAETYDALKNGLDSFTRDLLNSVSASQVSQNQWAQAWIGSIVPGINFGLGLDTGVATLSLKSIKKTAGEIGLDAINEISVNVLPLPTLNFDLRVGGFILPFDAGFTFVTLDTSKIGALDSALSGFGLKYFAIGGDFRYALIKDQPYDFKLSLNGGFYYSKIGISYEDEESDMINSADIGFNAMTFSTGAQVSAKLANFFVPYGGLRLILSRGNFNWAVSPNWAGLLDTSSGDINNAVLYFLPKTLEGGVKGKWIFRPQIYLGYALDLSFFDITTNLGYTFVSNVFNGNISFRFALN